MFRLDYLSCVLTLLATVLVGRKMWIGLVVSGVNSLIVCVIGLQTSQFGFIPANLFCICIYACSIRSWIKERKKACAGERQETHSDSAAVHPWIHSNALQPVRNLIQIWTRRAVGSFGSSFSAAAAKAR
jgi:hypothetical protein